MLPNIAQLGGLYIHEELFCIHSSGQASQLLYHPRVTQDINLF